MGWTETLLSYDDNPEGDPFAFTGMNAKRNLSSVLPRKIRRHAQEVLP
jgi:hypothetical protein